MSRLSCPKYSRPRCQARSVRGFKKLTIVRFVAQERGLFWLLPPPPCLPCETEPADHCTAEFNYAPRLALPQLARFTLGLHDVDAAYVLRLPMQGALLHCHRLLRLGRVLGCVDRIPTQSYASSNILSNLSFDSCADQIHVCWLISRRL